MPGAGTEGAGEGGSVEDGEKHQVEDERDAD